MGAFMLWDIRFKSEDDRVKFEKEYAETYIEQTMVDPIADSGGFCAWEYTRDFKRDIVYYVGYVGYEELREVLKECKKKKIGITFAAELPINDRMSGWYKVKGRHYK